MITKTSYMSMLILVWPNKRNKSSSPLGERIEVRGQFQGNTLTPALSRQGGREISVISILRR